MNEDFQQIYNSKCKFLRKYIDEILKPRGRGGFIRDIIFRAWKIYYPYRCNYKVVQKHLDSKFTKIEMMKIKAEKENRALIKKYIKEAEFKREDRAILYDKKILKLRNLEIAIMKNMGYKNIQIAKEFEISVGWVRQIIIQTRNKTQIKKLKEEIVDLNIILEQFKDIAN